MTQPATTTLSAGLRLGTSTAARVCFASRGISTRSSASFVRLSAKAPPHARCHKSCPLFHMDRLRGSSPHARASVSSTLKTLHCTTAIVLLLVQRGTRNIVPHIPHPPWMDIAIGHTAYTCGKYCSFQV
mmetsp:Transcript_59959/g.133617  ORF Transcript_59959/g.133617 Transcript_59959/m.133617 type:complete len:129 (-) Transcript_59959:49-435(-)